MSTVDRTAGFIRIVPGATALGLLFGAVVSAGIIGQRVFGSTVRNATLANLATTLAAVIALSVTVHLFIRGAEGAPAASARAREALARGVLLSYVGGALAGVLAAHAMLAPYADALPWLCEHPRQLVNDVVGVLGVSAFVWGCAWRPMRLEAMAAGLSLVLGYEITAHLWHLDGPAPVTATLNWSVQRFVGGEVTSSALGVLVFRSLFA